MSSVTSKLLPAGVTFVSTTGCTEDPNGVPTCSLGNLASGASVGYTITVDVDAEASGILTNTATLTSDTSDPITNNNTTLASTTVTEPPQPEADLRIAKDDGVTQVTAGDGVTYRIHHHRPQRRPPPTPTT